MISNYRLAFPRVKSKSSLMLIACMSVLTPVSLQAQRAPQTPHPNYPIEVSKEGDFFIDYSLQKILKSDMVNNFAPSLGLSPLNSFGMLTENTDMLGIDHAAYQQFFKGVPLEEGMVLLHSRDGLTRTLNGRVISIADHFSTAPQLAQKEAIAIAIQEEGLKDKNSQQDASLVITWSATDKKYVLAYKINLEGVAKKETYTQINVFVDATTGNIINKISLIAHATAQGTAHTLYSGLQEITMHEDSGVYRLYDEARNITTLNFDKGKYDKNGFVNMKQYINSSTTWEDVWSLDSVSLTTIGDTALIRNGKGWMPVMYVRPDTFSQYAVQGPISNTNESIGLPYSFSNIAQSMLLPPYNVYMTMVNRNIQSYSGVASFIIDTAAIKEGTHYWTDYRGNAGYYTIRKKPNVALDAHWGMGRTYDFYKEFFNRASHDKKNGPIINMINASYIISGTQSNAASIPGGIMVFGLGDRKEMGAVVCLDVLGHEYSHLVINENGQGGLAYQGESGALNESFADILGTCVEFYAKDTLANWTLGEAAFLQASGMFRSMSHPKVKGHPDTYQGQYWVDPTNIRYDNGGIHRNSGVQNKWFYLLCEGGSGTNDKKDNYQVTGIGMEKAQQIVYRNLTTYLRPYATFRDAFRGSLKATEDLYGKEGAEYKAVRDAWFAVGIDETTRISPADPVVMQPFKVYPNPAANAIDISATLTKAASVSVSVADISGRIVLRQDLGNFSAGNSVRSLDVSSLSIGSYVVKINFGTETAATKISIQR